eukprot:scaffold1_cov402-Prasinococcus_capsulatus_cf.AAC.39
MSNDSTLPRTMIEMKIMYVGTVGSLAVDEKFTAKVIKPPITAPRLNTHLQHAVTTKGSGTPPTLRI